MNDYNEESKYSIHLDVNGCFNRAISSYLPRNDFKWLTREEIKDSDAQTMSYRSKCGYLLEVILE